MFGKVIIRLKTMLSCLFISDQEIERMNRQIRYKQKMLKQAKENVKKIRNLKEFRKKHTT